MRILLMIPLKKLLPHPIHIFEWSTHNLVFNFVMHFDPMFDCGHILCIVHARNVFLPVVETIEQVASYP